MFNLNCKKIFFLFNHENPYFYQYCRDFYQFNSLKMIEPLQA